MLRKSVVMAAFGALVAMALASAAVAAHRGAKIAKGHTAQGRKIHIAVHPRSVQIKGFSIELRCSGGYVLIDRESGFQPSPVSRKGRIHDRQFGSTDEVAIRGRVAPNAVRGAIRVHDRLGHHHCASHWVRFTAHR